MRGQAAGLEATVTSKGQVTLPKRLREALGLKRGSRIRFRVETDGGLRGDPVLYELEDLWAIADQGRRPSVMYGRRDGGRQGAEALVIVVDTNIWARAFLGDHKDQAPLGAPGAGVGPPQGRGVRAARRDRRALAAAPRSAGWERERVLERRSRACSERGA